MKFRVLVADPPWKFGDNLPGPSRGASKNYPTMTIPELEQFPIPPMEDDALLFMWRVSSMVEEAYRVVRAWGFVPKTEMVWIKQTVNGNRWFGMGRTVRAEHETCIIAQRGKSIVRNRSVRSTFTAKAGRHSEKPAEFFRLVEELAPGPYAELFARQHRIGWTCFGNELVFLE